MNMTKQVITFISITLLASSVFADTYTENINLQRAINELNAAKVYVQKASESAAPNKRVTFHYKWVMADINKIESGIDQKFVQPMVQPRQIEPLKGDYLKVIGETPK